MHIAVPLTLTFYIDSAAVAASALVNVLNKSCGNRTELTIVRNTVRYKGCRSLTRSKIYPKSRREWEERSLNLSNCDNVQKSLGSKKRTFTDIPFVQWTLLNPFLLPRYVLALGGYQGTTIYCHANDGELLKGLPSNGAHFFTGLIPALKRKQNKCMNVKQHWAEPETPAMLELWEHQTCLWGIEQALLLFTKTGWGKETSPRVPRNACSAF